MKANRLWAIWAHLMLALVIASQVGWIVFAALFLIPKFQKLADDGIIDLAYFAADESWMSSFLDAVLYVYNAYAIWLVLAAALLFGLFEWRVKSEHKTLMRLSAFGAVAVGLTVVSALIGVSLSLPHLNSGPMNSRMAPTFAQVQIDHIDASLETLDHFFKKEDWEGMKAPASRLSQSFYNLDKARPAVRGLWSRKSPPVEELRAHVKDANDIMNEVRQAIVQNDAQQFEAALQKLRQAYAPVRSAADNAKESGP